MFWLVGWLFFSGMFLLRGIISLLLLLTAVRQFSRKKLGFCSLSSTNLRVRDKTFILTNSVDKSTSICDSSTSRHDIRPISQNRRFHYRCYRVQPPVPIPNHLNTVHSNSNSILLFMPRFSGGLFLSGLLAGTLHAFLSFSMRAPCFTNLIQHNVFTQIIFGEEWTLRRF